jgi:hypothetical protein
MMVHQMLSFTNRLWLLMIHKNRVLAWFYWISGTKKDATRRLKSLKWWPLPDLNRGPADYESDALTN